jgi:hypothetical protein
MADFMQAVLLAVQLCFELAQLCRGRSQLVVGLSLQETQKVVQGRVAGVG